MENINKKGSHQTRKQGLPKCNRVRTRTDGVEANKNKDPRARNQGWSGKQR